MSHLDALNLRLSNERIRLRDATTDAEREIRAVWVAQLEREIGGEIEFLGTDDDLLDALGI